MRCWNLDDSHLKLIQSARRGDKEAFTSLVRLYKDFVFRTAYSVTRDSAEAEDVVQETFMKAFTSFHTLKDERAFAKWIATIATRKALNVIRKQGRVHVSDDVVLSAVDVRSDTPISNRISLQELLEELSPDHRAVLTLREVQGFDYQEIASILEIPIGTVRSRLHTARSQLRKAVEKE